MSSFSQLNRPLGVQLLPMNYTGFTALAIELFSSPTTLIYLDTNVLAMPFRFHSEARKGFFSLLRVAVNQKRLFVPGWTSNEFFHNAFKNGATKSLGVNVKTQLGKLPQRAHMLSVLSQSAWDADRTMLADKYDLDPSQVLNHLAAIATDFNDTIDRLGKDLNPEIIHAEIDAQLGACCLALDFNAHCEMVNRHADRRRANRIPPGLSDGAKGDAKRGASAGNIDGDLALWLEILDHAAQQCVPAMDSAGAVPNYDCVIVLCEERKDDFLYTPPRRVGEPQAPAGTTIHNTTPVISLVDPRLVSEFECRLGHRNLAFLNIETIAQGWVRLNAAEPAADDIRSFAMALTQQKDNAKVQNAGAGKGKTEPADQAEEASAPVGAAPTDPAAGHAPATPTQLLAIPDGALNDEKAFLAALPAGQEKEVLVNLYTHNWYVQNPAIISLTDTGVPADHGAAFLTGRAVYQAADGGAWRANQFIGRFDRWAVEANDAQQALLAGAAYEALFDPLGKLREHPKTGNLRDVMQLLADARWRPARDFIRAQLQQCGARFYWLPGDAPIKLGVTVKGQLVDQRFIVASVTLSVAGFAGHELCRARAPAEHIVGDLSLKSLRVWLAEQAMIDADDVDIAVEPPAPDDVITFPVDLTMASIAESELVRGGPTA